MNEKVNTGDHHPELTERLRRYVPGARAECQILPQAPEMRLYLLNPDFPQHGLSSEQVQAILDYPAYWAFCWASGQVLARYLFDHPDLVSGKRVLDFGCGSGVAGIAAARVGAEVVACDIDPDALEATQVNAAVNGVALTLAQSFDACEGDFDLVLAADVLYDRENLPWLARFLARAPRALVADSRIREFSYPGYHKLDESSSNTLPDLDESAEFRRVSLYLGAPQ